MVLPPTASVSGVHVLPTVLRARQVLPRVRNKLARRRLRVIENFRPTRSKRAYLRQKDYDRGLRGARIERARMHVSSKRLRVLRQLVAVTDYRGVHGVRGDSIAMKRSEYRNGMRRLSNCHLRLER